MARDKLNDAIVELLDQKKTIDLDEAKQVLVKKGLGKPETIRKRFSELDGVVLKKVRRGRVAVLYQREFYRHQQEITFEARVSHTLNLKLLLRQLIGEVPVIDDHGVQPARNGVAPRVVGATPERYDPTGLMDSERDGLFNDLIDHLDLIEPPSRPTISARLAALKEQIGRLQATQDALWKASRTWTGEKLGLTYSEVWIDHGFSDTLPRYLFDHAMAAYRKDKGRAKFLAAPREVCVSRVKDRIEVGWGAEALFQHRAWKGITEEGLAKKAKSLLAQLPRAGGSSQFLGLAEQVDAELKRANEMRDVLMSRLRDAGHYEAYEGDCKYVIAA